jgi:NAD(P) transhydrogenase subunit alpha
LIAAVPKEILPLETRVSATPATVKELTKAGIIVQVEKNAGLNSYISDNNYKEAGAQIIESASTLYTNADIILKVQSPDIEEISQFNPGAVSVSFMQTTRATNLVQAMAKKPVTGFSMHLIPRTTLAQKMDALSSQANISGYKAVLVASGRIGKYMPLLMTAAGTIRPSKVLVLGAGVAGLQAIATAKRLGAQVEAFDVRPIVKEQVESLGAKFIEVESTIEEGVGEGGYAKETSEDYKRKQQELIHDHISNSDVVITTALIPGKPAPLLISKSMVQDMRPGSVIMDLAAENGGNCELTKKDGVIESNQVIIDGTSNFPATMPVHASELYAKNVAAFLLYTLNDGKLNLDLEDEIISGAMFTHQGKITHQQTQEAFNQSKDS